MKRRHICALGAAVTLVVACGSTSKDRTFDDGTLGAGDDGGAGTSVLPTDPGAKHDCAPDSLDQAGCACPKPGETRACYTSAAATRNVGACHDGTQTCAGKDEIGGTWGPCTGAVAPTTESCGGSADTNCNGKIGCADPTCAKDPACQASCKDGDKRACYDGPPGTENVGTCHDGTQTCQNGHWPATCTGEVTPSAEAGHCHDGLDNDCNGQTDCKDGACFFDFQCLTGCTPGTTKSCYTGPAGTDGKASCHGGTTTCKADGSGFGPCVGEVLPGVESGHCSDGIDNDCNGLVDCADPACSTLPACCVVDPSPADGTIYANSSDTLYKVDPTTFAVTTIGNFGTGDQMTDIAVTPSGALYGISFTTLYSVNKTTGAATAIAPVGGAGNVALTFLPDGTLLAADNGGDVKKINPATGAVTMVGNYGNGLAAAGDLVAVKTGTMYGTSVTSPGGGDASSSNFLIRVDVATGVATPVGATGQPEVLGLAYAGAKVIGFTSGGKILQIDPATGASSVLATKSIVFWGAGQSPLVDGNKCP